MQHLRPQTKFVKTHCGDVVGYCAIVIQSFNRSVEHDPINLQTVKGVDHIANGWRTFITDLEFECSCAAGVLESQSLSPQNFGGLAKLHSINQCRT